MNYIGEGCQSKVYEIEQKYVYKEYKYDPLFPIDKDAMEIMCNEIKNLKRCIMPIQLDYSDDGKIKGSISKLIISENIDLSSVKCSQLYEWYNDFIEDMKKLASFQIYVTDINTNNLIINSNGLFLIDVDAFKKNKELSQEELLKQNITDVNYCFLYGVIWKVGQFVSKQSFEEIFEEIKNFDGTIYQYLQLKNPYDYQDKDSTFRHL